MEEIDLDQYHHDEGESTQIKFKNDVKKLVNYWMDKGNPFDEDQPCLVNVFNRNIAPQEVTDCIFTLEGNGLKQYEDFVKLVLIEKKSLVLESHKE